MNKQDYSLPKGTKIPKHLALICDGNRRWAKARGLTSLQGHLQGFRQVEKAAYHLWHLGVHTFSIWIFSTENWDRSDTEVSYLMKLYDKFVKDMLKNADKYGVRIIHLGRKDRIPFSLKKLIQKSEKETGKNDKHILNICLDYGGKDEIVRAIETIIKKRPPTQKISEQFFENIIDTKNQPYPTPDLIIRTSGEQRLSGFMSWQNAYSELYFEKKSLPDFNLPELKNAIIDFSRRHRRFGGN